MLTGLLVQVITEGMSTLSQYLADARLTQDEFARRIGLSQAMVSKICRRTVGVSLATAVKIERATGGKVAVETLLHPEDGKAMSSPSLHGRPEVSACETDSAHSVNDLQGDDE